MLIKTKQQLYSLSLLIIVVFILGLNVNGQSKKGKPNIIFFLVDDMGWQDTSVPFWKEKTPLNPKFYTLNMERLASEGMEDTEEAQKQLVEFQNAVRGCNVEYIMKDISTVGYQPQRLWEWAEIAMKVVCE